MQIHNLQYLFQFTGENYILGSVICDVFKYPLKLSQDNKRNDVVHAYFGHYGKWQLIWRSMRLTKKHFKNQIQVLVKDIVKT